MVLRTDTQISNETAEKIARNQLYGEITEWDMKNGTDWEVVGCCVADLNNMEVDEEELEEEYARAEKWKLIAACAIAVAVFAACGFIGMSCFAAGLVRHG